MKKPNFVGGIFLIAYENGVKLNEVDTSTMSDLQLDSLLKAWKILKLTWIWDLRF